MNPYLLSISEANHLLSLSPKDLFIGSMYDHLAQQLVFTRPEGRDLDDLVLYFLCGGETYREDLGTGNAYLISNALTQWQTIQIQVAFIRGGEETEHSSIVKLRFRDSLDGAAPIPDPMPDPIQKLNDNAWYGAYEDRGDYLSVKNSRGEEVVQLLAGGDGGGSNRLWYPTVTSEGMWSSRMSSTTTPPEPVSIKGPQGEKGMDGQDGAQDLPGPAGADGAPGEPGEPGPPGADGQNGAPGNDGKSAYIYAVEGGYTGPESRFYADLAAMDGLAADLAAI